MSKGTRALTENLPKKYEWELIMDDIHKLRETNTEILRESYSRENPIGPFEVSLDPEKIEKALERGSENLSDAIAQNSEEVTVAISHFSEEITDYINDSNIFLESITFNTDCLPHIQEDLKHLREINRSNLVVSSLGVGFAIYHAERTLDSLHSIDEGIYEINENLEEVNESLDSIDEGIYEINENLEEVNESLDSIDEGIYEINENLEELVNGVNVLGRVTNEGFRHLIRGQNVLSNQLVRIHGEQQRSLNVLDANAGMRHTENLKQRQALAGTHYELRAEEKYNDALIQYKTGNFTASIRDIRLALREKSTHFPSLLLLARLNVDRLQWSDAKDLLSQASKIAEKKGDFGGYENAMLSLIEIEEAVGNKKQARSLTIKAARKYHKLHPNKRTSFLLERKRFDLEYQRLKKDDQSAADSYFRRFLNMICHEHLEFWDNLYNTEEFKINFLFSDKRYGPFMSLWRNNRELNFSGIEDKEIKYSLPGGMRNLGPYKMFIYFDHLKWYFGPISRILSEISAPHNSKYRINQNLVSALYDADDLYSEIKSRVGELNRMVDYDLDEILEIDTFFLDSANNLDSLFFRCYLATPDLELWKNPTMKDYLISKNLDKDCKEEIA